MKKCTHHDWIKTTFKRYDEVGGTEYYKCKKCGKKKKEWQSNYL